MHPIKPLHMLIALSLAIPTLARAQTAPTALPPAPRIISTVPAATLNLILIGAADRLVGVSKYDRLYLPDAQKNLPVIGDYETMNYEQLVSLSPTALVIQTDESRIAPRLRETAAQHHIDLVNMRFDHIADIWPSVRALGNAAGMPQEAEAAILNAQSDLKTLAETYAHQSPVKVLYIVSPKLMMTAGKNTFIDEMLSLAGAENLGAKVGGSFPDINREAITRLAPDVLLIGAADEPDLQAGDDDPRLAPWASLPIPAARNHRIELVTDGNALMASVNIGKNIRLLAGLIHRGESPITTTTPASTLAAQSPPAPPPHSLTEQLLAITVGILSLIILLPKILKARRPGARP